MAKANKVLASRETIDAATSIAFQLKYGDFSAYEAEVSPEGLRYLLQYGFAKSLQDSVAGYRKELTDQGLQDIDIAVALHDRMRARFDAIVAGTVGTSARGPRVAGIDRVMRDVSVERIKAAFARVKRPMAKGHELTVLVDKDIAKNGDAIRAEAERRMATMAGDGVELDLA